MSEPEPCQRCGEVDHDRRTLWMACFYEMKELGLPFLEIEESGRHFYTLRVCKECRGTWMRYIQSWFNTVEQRTPCGSGIFVRENGATVEITEDEWRRRNPGRGPVKVQP